MLIDLFSIMYYLPLNYVSKKQDFMFVLEKHNLVLKYDRIKWKWTHMPVSRDDLNFKTQSPSYCNFVNPLHEICGGET